MAAQIHPIGPDHAPLTVDLKAGGKAMGLSRLATMGFDIPPALVLTHLNGQSLTDDFLASVTDRLGTGPLAVRSSAEGEDGAYASYAGQFDTVLNVVGPKALREAIALCLASAVKVSSSYATDQRQPVGDMAIVVQHMVQPKWAGVIFTADPVSHRRDCIIVDAVRGLGEQLVSGEAQPDHFVLDGEAKITHRLVAARPTEMPDEIVTALAVAAAKAAHGQQHPLDLEWAIDAEDKIWWLQARPITTLAADPNELDIPSPNEDDVNTRCNIGEIMPGAVTPLTQSTTGRGIDHGTQRMMIAAGATRKFGPDNRAVASYFGHLFINLSTLARISGAVLGSQVQQIGMSICGRVVPELVPVNQQYFLRRLRNAVSYFSYLGTAEKNVRRFEPVAWAFKLDPEGSAVALYQRISRALPLLDQAYDVHMQSSAGSGAATGALHRIFAGDGDPKTEDYARIARLFSALGDLEGADLLAGLRQVAAAIGAHEDHQKRFVDASPAEALAWLGSEAAGSAQPVFANFLKDHGHRAFRELEMYQPGWRDDPLPLITSFQTSLVQSVERKPDPSSGTLDNEPFHIRLLITKARNAVQRRERTKALLVHITNEFKCAYRSLGQILAQSGALEEASQIFFLRHEEIAQCFDDKDRSISKTATRRLQVFDIQAGYRFADVFTGKPEPLTPNVDTVTDNIVEGLPVSTGIVEGFARVARDPSEAQALQPGDILIAPITDIGWTPYFRLIAGLATDIGSSVSHGAVIAREYGLPALVNTGNGTSVIKSGDRIRLDANNGRIEILESAGEAG
jgi:phosphohistidine swiveling domain-containing protein